MHPAPSSPPAPLNQGAGVDEPGCALGNTTERPRCPSTPPPPPVAGVLVDALLTVSQLARISRDNYDPIARAGLYPPIRRLLVHPDAGVRARVCNLVGNMCRHSGFFYSALERHGLLVPLIDRCGQATPETAHPNPDKPKTPRRR